MGFTLTNVDNDSPGGVFNASKDIQSHAATASDASLKSFQESYLGALSSDPTTTAYGTAVSEGMIYFNTTDDITKVHNGTSFIVMSPGDTSLANIDILLNKFDGSATATSGTTKNLALVNAVATDAADIGEVASKATEIGLLGTSNNITAMGHLGTAAAVEDMGILGTTNVVADMAILGTSDVVADLNTLATSDIISDMNDLATSANITAMGHLGTSVNVTAMGTLGNPAVVSNINALNGTNVLTYISNLNGTDVINNINALNGSGVISNISTVTNIQADVTKVANIDANVTKVADIDANVTKVADIDANVTKVAVIDGNVTTVAGIDSAVTAVAAIHGNVTTVAGINTTHLSNVSGVATNVGLLGTSGAVSDINDVAGQISPTNNINTVATAISNINLAVTNLSSINNFANKYRIASSAPSSDNDDGDLYYNTSSNTLYLYDGSAWQQAVFNTAGALFDSDFGSQGIILRGASSGSYSILTDNSSNWNTAFGWGNHASAGYAVALNAALTGNPTAPTQATSDNSIKIATTAYVAAKVTAVSVTSDDVTALAIALG